MKRVLLVEDNTGLRETMSMIIAVDGYDVVAVDCVSSAVEELLQLKYDFVLSDIEMHGEATGIDLIKFMVEKFPETPIVLMSGSYTCEKKYAQVLGQFLEIGAWGFISKPFGSKKLLQLIAATIGYQKLKK